MLLFLMGQDEPLDFDFWQVYTQQRLYLGQLEPLKKWISGEVLDVASNYGRFSTLSQTTTSIDIEKRYLQQGRELGDISRPIIASALDLPFNDRAFDTIIAMGIVDHIPYDLTLKLLKEITRVVKQDGTVVIQVTSPFSLHCIRFRRSYHDYVHPYSPFRILRELRLMGWVQVHIISSGLVGSVHFLPQTIDTFIPWAVHVTFVLKRFQDG